MKTTSQKFQISGNSIFARFIRQNIDEIVERKINLLNAEKGFLYVTEDGEFKEGRNDERGQSMIESFGGKSANEYSAVADLQELINAEPLDNDLYNEKLKALL